MPPPPISPSTSDLTTEKRSDDREWGEHIAMMRNGGAFFLAFSLRYQETPSPKCFLSSFYVGEGMLTNYQSPKVDNSIHPTGKIFI